MVVRVVHRQVLMAPMAYEGFEYDAEGLDCGASPFRVRLELLPGPIAGFDIGRNVHPDLCEHHAKTL